MREEESLAGWYFVDFVFLANGVLLIVEHVVWMSHYLRILLDARVPRFCFSSRFGR